MADNLTIFMCRMSLNLGASTSWNPQGLSRPVMGLLLTTVLTIWYEEKDTRCEETMKCAAEELPLVEQQV